MKQSFSVIGLAVLLSLGYACSSSKKTTSNAYKPTDSSNKTAASTAESPSECNAMPVTYNGELKEVVNKQCATSGCHDAAFAQMDFTSYPLLKKFADEGEMKKHVLVRKDMPPYNRLSAKELQLFKCWLENGADEN